MDTWILLTLVCFSGGLVAGEVGDRAASLSGLLEEAIFAEESLGDLDRAIDIYQEILSRAEAEQSFVAQAQLRLGLCHLKKGNEEAAIEALRTLVEKFPKQQELVAEARGRLAELGILPPEPGVVVRLVWEGDDVDVHGAPSPDGKLLPFIDWATGDLAIRDLSTGEKRRLTDKGSWLESIEFADYPRMSSDGRKVAFAWFNQDLFYDLRMVELGSSEPEVVYRDEDVEFLQPAGWTPDGREILTLLGLRDRTYQIALVSIDDRSARVLKRLDWRSPLSMSLSPDGRFVVYDLPPDESSTRRDIFLLAVDGSRDSRLIEHPGEDLYPVWAPDGRRIVFCSDRTGAMGIWAVEVVDGERRGPAHLLKSDIGSNALMGFTRQGTLFFGHMAWANTGNVYTASLTSTGAETPRIEPQAVNQRFIGSDIAPDWSRDGEYLAYVSRRGPPWSRDKVIVVRSSTSGEEKELPLSISQYVTRPRWSPDSGSFLMVGRDGTNRRGVYRMDARTGEVTLVTELDTSGLIGGLEWSADGTAVYYQHIELETQGQSIERLDLQTGRTTSLELPSMPTWVNNVALSPDGRHWAMTMGHPEPPSTSLVVMSVEGGPSRELLRFGDSEEIEGGLWVDGIAWSADGRHVLFGKHRQNDPEQRVDWWRVSVEGGEPEPLGLAMPNLRDVRAHPDGRSLAFTAGKFGAEVWVMENFLPGESEGP